MCNVLDHFLRLLTTGGEWHNVTDIAVALRRSEEQTFMIAQFLARYHLIRFNDDEKRVAIDSQLKEFFLSTRPEKPFIKAGVVAK